MASTQTELFAEPAVNAPDATRSDVAWARERLQGMLARAKEAATTPWPDPHAAIQAIGAFQRGMSLLPAAEAESLWAAFCAELDRFDAQGEIARA
jgi:hypothetical protein